MKRAALYLRVSTASKKGEEYRQNPAVQEHPLREMCKNHSWQIVKLYSDRASGANESRTQYKALMEDARRKKFDVVLCFRFDRFARSLKELVGALEEFQALGIEFVSYREAVDTSTPTGRLMFHMVSAFAEFERSLIQERIHAGMEYARRHGTKSGKAIGGQKKVFRRDRVLELRREGKSFRKIARELKIGLGTVARICTTTPSQETGKNDANTGVLRSA